MSVDILPSREVPVIQLKSPEPAGKLVVPGIRSFLSERNDLLRVSIKSVSLVIHQEGTVATKFAAEKVSPVVSTGLNLTSKGSEKIRFRRGRSPRGVCPKCKTVYRLRDGHYCSGGSTNSFKQAA